MKNEDLGWGVRSNPAAKNVLSYWKLPEIAFSLRKKNFRSKTRDLRRWSDLTPSRGTTNFRGSRG